MRPWSSVGFVLSLACMAMWVSGCGNEGGAPKGAGAAGAAGGTGFDAGLGPPTFEAQFTSGDGFTSRWPRKGSVTFGADDSGAEDHEAVTLLFPGDAQLGPTDGAGPGNASEIDTLQKLSFGTYRTRAKLATCAANEELVNGIFTYFNDGTDHDGDNIVDNSEIDIEILCNSPAKISLTVWTEYASDMSFVKLTRVIDTRTGDYSESPSDHEYGLVPKGRDDAFRHPGFPNPDTFYEMGFEWQKAEIRYFIVLDGQEITLWDLKDAAHVPQLDAPFLFNLWHAPTDWWTGAAADYPAADATMTVDWFRYWKN